MRGRNLHLYVLLKNLLSKKYIGMGIMKAILQKNVVILMGGYDGIGRLLMRFLRFN